MNEYKIYEMQNVKSSTEGNGTVSGLGNTIYQVDKGGDIAIEYTGLADLVKSGFIADTHGISGGKLGDYTYEGMIGMIDSAEQTDEGLQAQWSFHSTPKAQAARTTVQERIDAGKAVYMSIGYNLSEPPVFVEKQNYKTVLPRYIPKNKLQSVLNDAEKFSRVRLIKAKVNEISIVPNPMNQGSVVTSYKAMDTEFKAEFLGEDIIDSLQLSILSSLSCRLMNYVSNLLCPPSWVVPVVPEDGKTERDLVEGAVLEFAEVFMNAYDALLPLDIAEDEADSMKSFIDEMMQYKATWNTAYVNSLPDSSFAYIEPGGEKDEEGKTKPRSLRHFPYKDKDGKPDAAHVRNALARIPQSKVSAAAKASAIKKVQSAAKDLGIKSDENNSEFKAGAEFSQKNTKALSEAMGHFKSIMDAAKQGHEMMKSMTAKEEKSAALEDLEKVEREYEFAGMESFL